jgi:hypothetical protein
VEVAVDEEKSEARVRAEAWPDPANADELHDALVWLGFLSAEEAQAQPSRSDWLAALARERRVTQLHGPQATLWITAERLPADEEEVIVDAMERHDEVKGFHRLRSRSSGTARFAEVDVFVDPELTVSEAHDLVSALEDEIHAELPNLITTIHVEPYEEGRREGSVRPDEEFSREA